MNQSWQCKFKTTPEQITVGQKLILVCQGEPKINLKLPLSIDFIDKKDKYSLHLLNTLKKEDQSLVLEVTSYRPGEFKKAFIITDGNQGLVIEDLSFSVQSVLKENPTPPSPFGPFRPPVPLWHFSAIAFTFLGLLLCVLYGTNRILKRRKYIQKILARKNNLHPSQSFIVNLRKQEIESSDYKKNLEQIFKTFLEDLFLIPAINQSNSQIMKSLKQQQYSIYKKFSGNIRQILNEFTNDQTIDRQNAIQLKKLCQEMVFLLESEGNKK